MTGGAAWGPLSLCLPPVDCSIVSLVNSECPECAIDQDPDSSVGQSRANRGGR